MSKSGLPLQCGSAVTHSILACSPECQAIELGCQEDRRKIMEAANALAPRSFRALSARPSPPTTMRQIQRESTHGSGQGRQGQAASGRRRRSFRDCSPTLDQPHFGVSDTDRYLISVIGTSAKWMTFMATEPISRP
jgi:hypothetical protein